MAGAMVHSIKTISYQFKGGEVENNSNTSFLGRMFAKDSDIQNNPITPMKTNTMETTQMKTTPINTTKMNDNKTDSKVLENNKINNHNNSISTGRKIFNTGKEFMNMGMYMAEGRNFKTNREFERHNINNSRKEDYKNKEKEDSTIANIQEQDKL